MKRRFIKCWNGIHVSQTNSTDFCWILVSKLDVYLPGGNLEIWKVVSLLTKLVKHETAMDNLVIIIKPNVVRLVIWKKEEHIFFHKFLKSCSQPLPPYPHLHPSPPPSTMFFASSPRATEVILWGFQKFIAKGGVFFLHREVFGGFFCIQMTSDMSITNRICWWISDDILMNCWCRGCLFCSEGKCWHYKWTRKTPSWWFQPIWKILVKLDHFPK